MKYCRKVNACKRFTNFIHGFVKSSNLLITQCISAVSVSTKHLYWDMDKKCWLKKIHLTFWKQHFQIITVLWFRHQYYTILFVYGTFLDWNLVQFNFSYMHESIKQRYRFVIIFIIWTSCIQSYAKVTYENKNPKPVCHFIHTVLLINAPF